MSRRTTNAARGRGLMPGPVFKAARRRSREVTACIAALVAGIALGAYWYGTTTPSAQPPGAAAVTPISHIVTILEENHNAAQVTAATMPYLTALGATYAHTTALSALGHPSLPNYLGLTSGGTQGKLGTDCGSSTSGCTTGADNIYHQGSWAQWSESMPGHCAHANKRPYVVHHAPAPFYTDLAATCAADDIPLVRGAVPQVTAAYTFVTPNLDDDAHDGTLEQADAWLKAVIPQLQAQPAYTSGAMLIEVTFDEGAAGNNTVTTVFVNPRLSHVVVAVKATHYSTLRLNETLLGYPLLAGAKTAPAIQAALGL